MAETTKISWAHSTHNFWVGCTKISPACDHCYAADWAKRTGQSGLWSGELRRTTPQNWRKPLSWNAKAAKSGETHRVFSSSLSDFFDNQAPAEWRDDAWALIRATPHLTWLLLTKRPQNIARMLPPDWAVGYDNVWLGTTAEDNKHYRQRWQHLAAIPARIRFLSFEPALDSIGDLCLRSRHAPNWVIVGGESGHHARPMHPDWVRNVRSQCSEARVAFHFKQWGTHHGKNSHDAPLLDGRTWQEFPS